MTVAASEGSCCTASGTGSVAAVSAAVAGTCGVVSPVLARDAGIVVTADRQETTNAQK